eukprot:CAMPEP_0118939056 /NCGR_PEP_ID=MMETSP1169-20130426/27832_1 /TAXON_ID=36882 /ORGANISM="Pyramimonas obovata, Strain CCMP722" /LENGTH=144 /DNA_ID=CAMNT_0006883227 /DNA_START=173 /DNA_END=603 /DNA_ORIENTATION=+
MSPASKGLGGILVFLLSVLAGSGALADTHVSIQPGSHDHDFRVSVTEGASTHLLQLHVSNDFLSKDFVVGRLNKDGTISSQKHQPAPCHYDGSVQGEANSLAAVSTCGGVLEGFYDLNGVRTTIHPVRLSEATPGARVAANVTR